MQDYLIERTDVRGPDECWPWVLSTGSHGYGQGWDGSTVVLAHRATYEAFIGAIPTDMTVDHLCHVRLCQNPTHLRLRTNLENASDNGMATRTRCPRGHAYDDENTYRDRKGHRRCRKCARITKREWKAAQKMRAS